MAKSKKGKTPSASRRMEIKANLKRKSELIGAMRRYLTSKGIMEPGSQLTKFSNMAEITLGAMGIPIATRISYGQVIGQLYDNGKFGEHKVSISGSKVKVGEYKSPRKIEYEAELKNIEWLTLRSRIIQRDNGRCQMCDTNKELQVHHKRYINGAKAWEHPDSLLITVCQKCHSRHHGKSKN